MSKDAAPNGREPIKIARLKFVMPQTGPSGGLSSVPDAIHARDIEDRAIYAIEYHPWIRRYKVTNLKTGVSFGIHEHRVDWSQTLAEWQEGQKAVEARKKAA